MRLLIFSLTVVALLGRPAIAGSPKPDPQVQNAFIYQGYAQFADGISEEHLICHEHRLVSETAYQGLLPLALRMQAALACQNGDPTFSVPGYGNLHFTLTSGSGIPAYNPEIADLKTEYTRSHSDAPKVYFIVNVLKIWDAILIAVPEIEALQAKGFQVIFAQGFTKADLLRVIADDSTYGIVLDSHGQEPFIGLGGGYWADSQEQLISPNDIRTTSANLKFFSALACYGEDRAQAYRQHLHLSSERFHFLIGLHSQNVIDYYFRSRPDQPYDPIGVFEGGDFSPERDMDSARQISQIYFGQQVESLSAR